MVSLNQMAENSRSQRCQRTENRPSVGWDEISVSSKITK